MHIADLAGSEQLWIANRWHERFGMAPDAEDFGTRHTLAQVGAVQAPDAATLLRYHDAVAARTDVYVETLSAEDLDRVLDEPQFTPRPTVGVRLVSLMHHVAHHAAQADYLRGLIDGRGA